MNRYREYLHWLKSVPVIFGSNTTHIVTDRLHRYNTKLVVVLNLPKAQRPYRLMFARHWMRPANFGSPIPVHHVKSKVPFCNITNISAISSRIFIK